MPWAPGAAKGSKQALKTGTKMAAFSRDSESLQWASGAALSVKTAHVLSMIATKRVYHFCATWRLYRVGSVI